MARNFCWMAAILVIISTFSVVSWAQEESKKPDYLREKEQAMKSEKSRIVERKESDKSTQEYIKALTKELEELKVKLKELPADKDEEARDYQKRMAEIEKEIANLKWKDSNKSLPKKTNVAKKPAPAKKLSSAEAQKRIERLRKDLEETRKKILELKRTNPDSPRLKELRAHIAERERMIKQLTPQVKRKPAPQRVQRAKVTQMRLEIFTLKNIDADSAFKIVREFMTPGGIVVPVSHTNSLIIRDTQKNLQEVEIIIKHIDMKARP